MFYKVTVLYKIDSQLCNVTVSGKNVGGDDVNGSHDINGNTIYV